MSSNLFIGVNVHLPDLWLHHVTYLFCLNLYRKHLKLVSFQGSEDEHKLGESHPGGDGRTGLRISVGENHGGQIPVVINEGLLFKYAAMI